MGRMGYHGWQGDPPGAEDEARRRIVQAAIACIDRAGLAKTNLSHIAAETGVTRQTVYRYFPSLTEILRAVALAGAEEFAERMRAHLSSFDSPVAVESVVFAVRSLPTEPHLGLLLQAGEADLFTAGATTPPSFSLGTRILRDAEVDWASVGVTTDAELQGLAEVLMRLFMSFLQFPSTPPATDDELRDLVRRWIGPALRG